jgi:hypothetical protein
LRELWGIDSTIVFGCIFVGVRMKKMGLFAGVAAAALLSISPASAATITYTAKGVGSATVGGIAYSGAFTAIGVGDTNSLFHPPGLPGVNVVALSTFKILFGQSVLTGADPTFFFVNPAVNFNGFNFAAAGAARNLLNFRFASPSNWDGISNFGPVGTSTTFTGIFPYATDAGAMTNRVATVTSFQAVLGNAGGAPEPASWAMMIAGFGLAGAALRRKVRTTVSFA